MMNTLSNEKQNSKYRKKYKFLKQRVIGLILENAALCDEVAKIQQSILIVKDERKFLLRKVLEYENNSDLPQMYYKTEPINISNGLTVPKLKKRKSVEEMPPKSAT